jgi:hypothetical protein
MWRLNDLFASIPAHPAELLSIVALENLNHIRERGRRIVETDRGLLREFLVRAEGISAPALSLGQPLFCARGSDNVDNFLTRLRTEHDPPPDIFSSAQSLPCWHGSRHGNVSRGIVQNKPGAGDGLKE